MSGGSLWISLSLKPSFRSRCSRKKFWNDKKKAKLVGENWSGHAHAHIFGKRTSVQVSSGWTRCRRGCAITIGTRIYVRECSGKCRHQINVEPHRRLMLKKRPHLSLFVRTCSASARTLSQFTSELFLVSRSPRASAPIYLFNGSRGNLWTSRLTFLLLPSPRYYHGSCCTTCQMMTSVASLKIALLLAIQLSETRNSFSRSRALRYFEFESLFAFFREKSIFFRTGLREFLFFLWVTSLTFHFPPTKLFIFLNQQDESSFKYFD